MKKDQPVFGKPADFFSKELQTERHNFHGGAYGEQGGTNYATASLPAYDYALIKICAALAANPAYVGNSAYEIVTAARLITDKLFE